MYCTSGANSGVGCSGVVLAGCDDDVSDCDECDGIAISQCKKSSFHCCMILVDYHCSPVHL